MAEARYLISDAAKKVDGESHVLRYWEEELELNIPRNEMGHRYYTDYHIRLFRRVKELKEKGYQLKAIKGVLDRLNGVSGEITITEEDMEREMRKTWLAERWPAPDMEGEQMKREKRIVVDGGRKRSVEEAAMQTPSAEQAVGAGVGKDTGNNTGNNIGNPIENHAGNHVEENTEDDAGNEDLRPVGNETQGEMCLTSQEKLQQLQMLFDHMVGQAMDEKLERLQNELADKLGDVVSNTVGDRVTDRVMREVEYLMRVSDEKEEERYRQLDAAIRSTQKSGKSHAEAAATKLPFFRKKRFGKSGKKLF